MEEGKDAPDTPMSAHIVYLGASQAVPRSLQVQLGKRIFSRDEVGQAPPQFTLQMAPPVEGALLVKSEDQLEFLPEQPLTPGTEYEATVTYTPADGETVAGPWTRKTTTPDFGLTRARIQRRRPNDIRLELEFSAPVQNLPEDALSVRFGGAEPNSVQLSAGAQPELRLVSIRVPPGIKATDTGVQIALEGGRAAWVGNATMTAPAKSFDLSLTQGPQVRIRDAWLEEGDEGWFIEVICYDAAAGGSRHRYFPKRSRHYSSSSRCEIDPEFAKTFVRTDPATELRFSSGSLGFRVFADFARGPLKFVMDSGTQTIDGGILQSSFERTFTIGARTPSARFADQGRYLPKSAWTNLAIEHLNLEKLPVEIRHVPPENLVFWLTGEETMTDRTSQRIIKTEVAVPNRPDERVTSFLSIGSMVPFPEPGVYEIRIDDKPGGSARLLQTELHLVAKAAGARKDTAPVPEIQVWALDAHSIDGISGVKVRAVQSSGRTVAECTTSASAGCALPIPIDPLNDNPPVALIATKGNDLTYLKLTDLKLDPPDTGGEPYSHASTYELPLWTDRGVYRPGDVVHLAGVVRQELQAPPAGVPVEITLFDPKDQERKQVVIDTNDVGMVAADFAIGGYANTGRYRIEASIGKTPVGRLEFQVEEFVPERLDVDAESPPGPFLATDAVPVQVNAQWLFGGSAAGARAEIRCQLTPYAFSTPSLPGWSFGPAYMDGAPQPVDLGTVQTTLGSEGQTTAQCSKAEANALSGPAQLTAFAAVFEGTSGRTTVDRAQTLVLPEPFLLGLNTDAAKATHGQPMSFSGVIVDTDGKVLSDTPPQVEVTTYQMDEQYNWYYYSGRSNRQRELSSTFVDRTTTPVKNGRFSFQITPQIDSAGTLVRVRIGDAVTERFVEGIGRRYWWNESEPGKIVDATPRPVRPGSVGIEAPAQVKVDESFEVVLTAPYAGRMLVTLETDEVVRSSWIDAVAGENRWSVSVDTFVPNVYVSALLIKDPHLESETAFLPDRAYGARSVKIEPTAYARPITLSHPEEVRPYSTLTVEVAMPNADGPAYATVAAVDEGILSLTGFETPDPLADLFRKRALGVTSYETIGWALSSGAGGTSSQTGGGAGEGEAPGGGRVQMVKPVALWSGVVELTDGKATVDLEVPGYRGKLRVMAVAVTQRGLGAAEGAVTVRDPLVLLTTLPRFLHTEDEVAIPVQVTNDTGADRDVTIVAKVEELRRGADPDGKAGPALPPPIGFLRDSERQTVRIPKGKTRSVKVWARARKVPGAARFTITAQAGREKSLETLDLPIETPQSPTRRITTLQLKQRRLDLKEYVDGWAYGSDRTTLWLTGNPYAESLTRLQHLVRYPFG